MSDVVKNRTRGEAIALMEAFQHYMKTGENSTDIEMFEPFGGIHEHPVRIKCATLGWHTLKAALLAEGNASTEAVS